METGPVEDIFYRCRHPYTEALQRSIPQLSEIARSACWRSPAILRIRCICRPAARSLRDARYRLECCDKSVPPLEAVGEGHGKPASTKAHFDAAAELVAGATA